MPSASGKQHVGGAKVKRILEMTLVLLIVLLSMQSKVALAHHSKAHYGNQELTTNGTVVEYKWRNPHVFVVWDAKDQSGKTTQWIGEMNSVTSMIADGMTKNSLKPGDQVTIVVFPSKNSGSSEALIKKIMKADGTVVVDYGQSLTLRQP
jgi:hypothetical protein